MEPSRIWEGKVLIVMAAQETEWSKNVGTELREQRGASGASTKKESYVIF